MDVNRFYVYQFCRGEKCVYIGKGSGSRFSTQRRRFRGFVGSILEYFRSGEDALKREQKLIHDLRPEFNVLLNPLAAGCRREPWRRRLVPKDSTHIDGWCERLGTRQMALRILLSRWPVLHRFGIDYKTLLPKLENWDGTRI